jgi:hypothetical protein
MPDRSIKVGAIGRGKNKEIRVLLAEFQGAKYVDIRAYYQDKDDGEWKPTKSGVTVPPAKLSELRDLLDVAEEQAESAGWL